MSDVTPPLSFDRQPLVMRHDLARRLDVATTRPLTVMQAPAGYGKTEALQRWSATTRHLTGWVNLEEDTGRHGFWNAVLATLRDSVHVDRATPAEQVTESFRAAAARWPAATTLIIEDVDRMRDGAARNEVARLADTLPPNLRLVVTSRQQLHLPISRWRLQGRVDELGPADLRFRPRDSAALLRERGTAELHPGAVQALTDRAEGWPAGVQLLATGDRLDSDRARALTGETLRGQPEDVQLFLLTTAVLGRFSADLCRAVTGNAEVGRLLRTVVDAGLFVVPLDEEHGWFRYNRLVAELWQRELERRRPGRAQELHRRAAAWFSERHVTPDAVRHLVAADDPGAAFALVSADPYGATWSQLLGVQWTELFPAEWIAREPTRMLHFATLLGRSGQLDEATAWLQRAEAAIAERPDDAAARRLLTSSAALWCGVNLHAQRTIDLGREVLQRPEDDAGNDFHTRVRVALASSGLLLDDLDTVVQACSELDVPQSNEIVRGVMVPGFRARIALRRGLVRASEELCHRVLRTAEAMGIPRHPGVRDALYALGGVRAERDQLDAAEASYEQAARLADGLGWPAVAAQYRLGVVQVRAAADGPAEGLARIAELRSGLVTAMPGPELIEELDLAEAEIRLAAGEVDVAREMLRRLPPGIHADQVRVRAALAQGDLEAAAAGWAMLPATNYRDQLVCDLLGARLAAASGDSQERDRRLFAAARTAQVEGFGRTFATDGYELLPALRDLARRDPHLVDLVDRISLIGRPTDGLSERETVVLRYLASSLTHQEIANELGVSTNTVKSHVRALYRKLGVRSRPEALTTARHRALL